MTVIPRRNGKQRLCRIFGGQTRCNVGDVVMANTCKYLTGQSIILVIWNEKKLYHCLRFLSKLAIYIVLYQQKTLFTSIAEWFAFWKCNKFQISWKVLNHYPPCPIQNVWNFNGLMVGKKSFLEVPFPPIELNELKGIYYPEFFSTWKAQHVPRPIECLPFDWKIS